jgi:hypothetical protein
MLVAIRLAVFDAEARRFVPLITFVAIQTALNLQSVASSKRGQAVA